ncbi:hypothetical protein L226DRAFT_386301 [Lentinus tigrinus ALCF2SS1-7]|uniref:uncharacterized protein n=1 Tax=Lentinus tigrinus ALCF2SS1-7 TaxID=1328758 RepID=UPI001165E974|nr:hypothetical protein L226DRAFT_401185 [Lentinus tigrinus ALCF2SS1-7]RPD67841.1 hypothetical protein L226DRAFT_386301 [Lentinus tigrinus ALCF2SS1-7]
MPSTSSIPRVPLSSKALQVSPLHYLSISLMELSWLAKLVSALRDLTSPSLTASLSLSCHAHTMTSERRCRRLQHLHA